MHKNHTLTQELVEVVDPIPQECYRNSILALYAYCGDAPAVYVEGFVAILDGTLLIEHGWLEIAGGLVDVTLTDVEPRWYFPVFRYTKDTITAIKGRRSKLYPPFFARDREAARVMRQTEWRLYETTIGGVAREFLA